MLSGPVRIHPVRSLPFAFIRSLTGKDFCVVYALQIRDHESALLVAQLLFLEAEESSKPIHLYINSPGGHVTAGMAIYDTVSWYPSLD